MLRANYTDQEKDTFRKLRCDYPDRRIMERFEVLWLHSCGKFALEIATLTGIHVNTVRKHITNYAKGGIKLITAIDSNHPTSELGKHQVSIIEEFKANAITGQLTTVANDGYITATTFGEMLHKLAKQYAGRPITIVLDNASRHGSIRSTARRWRRWRRS